MLRLKRANRPEPDDLLEPSDAARLLGIETADLRKLRLKTYSLPTQRLYRRGDLEAWLTGSDRERAAELRRLNPSDSIRDLRVTTRARNALLSDEIVTVGQLARCRPEHLLRIPNIGHQSLVEIEQALAEAGYRLGEGSGEEGREAPAPEKRAGRSDTRKPQPRREGPQYPTA